jgi:hypothetical protein
MKQFSVLLFILFVFVIDNQCVSQNNATRQKKATIGAGESILTEESCFILNSGKDDIFFITRKFDRADPNSVKQFYVYDNGVKKGPLTAVPEEMMKKCGDTNNECAAYEPQGNIENSDESIIQVNDNTITFKGKQFGPYDQIASFAFTKDKSKFWAVVVIEKKYNMICSDGRKLELLGFPDRIIVSPDGNYAVIKCLGNMKSIDDAASMMVQGALDKVTIYAIDGKKFGPFSNEEFNNNGIWYPSTCNSYFFVIGQKLYRDGIYVKDFESINKCGFWTSSDGKRFVNVSYDNIVFSDGEIYPYPLRVKLITEGGKTFVKWVSLDNITDVVLYKKEL